MAASLAAPAGLSGHTFGRSWLEDEAFPPPPPPPKSPIRPPPSPASRTPSTHSTPTNPAFQIPLSLSAFLSRSRSSTPSNTSASTAATPSPPSPHSPPPTLPDKSPPPPLADADSRDGADLRLSISSTLSSAIIFNEESGSFVTGALPRASLDSPTPAPMPSASALFASRPHPETPTQLRPISTLSTLSTLSALEAEIGRAERAVFSRASATTTTTAGTSSSRSSGSTDELGPIGSLEGGAGRKKGGAWKKLTRAASVLRSGRGESAGGGTSSSANSSPASRSRLFAPLRLPSRSTSSLIPSRSPDPSAASSIPARPSTPTTLAQFFATRRPSAPVINTPTQTHFGHDSGRRGSLPGTPTTARPPTEQRPASPTRTTTAPGTPSLTTSTSAQSLSTASSSAHSPLTPPRHPRTIMSPAEFDAAYTTAKQQVSRPLLPPPPSGPAEFGLALGPLPPPPPRCSAKLQRPLSTAESEDGEKERVFVDLDTWKKELSISGSDIYGRSMERERRRQASRSASNSWSTAATSDEAPVLPPLPPPDPPIVLSPFPTHLLPASTASDNICERSGSLSSFSAKPRKKAPPAPLNLSTAPSCSPTSTSVTAAPLPSAFVARPAVLVRRATDASRVSPLTAEGSDVEADGDDGDEGFPLPPQRLIAQTPRGLESQVSPLVERFPANLSSSQSLAPRHSVAALNGGAKSAFVTTTTFAEVFTLAEDERATLAAWADLLGPSAGERERETEGDEEARKKARRVSLG